MKSLFAAVSLLALTAGAALAQDAPPLPQPTPMPASIPAPRDVAYPGVIKLSVDATDLDRRIFNVHETIPVSGAGPLTLLYPKWIPGNHSPTGQIANLGGLEIFAGGRRLEWVRDPVDVFAFHVDVPAGVSALDLDFQFLSAVDPKVGRIVMTPEMMSVQWFSLSLYPAGYFTRGITIEPSIKLPERWDFATALETAAPGAPGQVKTFKPVSYEQLLDSPMIAGRYFKHLDLDPGAPTRVTLDVMADRPELLEVKPEQLAAHRNLVQQAYKLYGSHHYDHYDFLFSLSERMGGIGVEHHQSSEDGSGATYFTEWDKNPQERDLLPHEYTHSWNGKFRRGADLWTPNYDVPMRNSLLWVYEGQTQYWGYVLAARSGLLTRSQAMDAIAATAATYDHRVGRAWKPLIDTTNDPIIAMRKPLSWRSWSRSEDYYSEGQLIWLDADTLIRELSGGKKSLDDFARAFFGVNNGSFVVRTYDFDEVVATLNKVQPYDWATFLKTRLEGHGPGAPLDGLKRGGYRLVYTDQTTEYGRAVEMGRKYTDLTYSLGMMVGRDGAISEVLWEGPAFKAGLTSGGQIIAVNGVAYDSDTLKGAVRAAKGTAEPIELIVKVADRYKVVRIDYHDGLRYPHLERDPSVPARLDDILAPRK